MKSGFLNRVVTVLTIISAVLGLVGCDKGNSGPVPGTTPIDQLIASGKAPVETGALVRGISPVMPTFTMTVKNVSDMPVSLINGTVIFFDGDGKALPDTVQEAGYTDLSPVEPGATVELQIMSANEQAVSGKYILGEVIYEKSNPQFKEYGALPMKWENPNHDAAVESEKAR